MAQKQLSAKQAEVLSFASAGIPMGRSPDGRVFQGGEWIQPATWEKIRRYFRRVPTDRSPFAFVGEYEVTQTGRNKATEYYRKKEEEEMAKPLEVDELSKLPGWHMDHCCGMYCDGQDGTITSQCGREKATGPPADAREIKLVGKAVEEAARMRRIRLDIRERQSKTPREVVGPARGIYRHKNGMPYEVIGVSTSTDDPYDYVVVYRALYGDYKLYHRPWDEFNDGRFTLEKEIA